MKLKIIDEVSIDKIPPQERSGGHGRKFSSQFRPIMDTLKDYDRTDLKFAVVVRHDFLVSQQFHSRLRIFLTEQVHEYGKEFIKRVTARVRGNKAYIYLA